MKKGSCPLKTNYIPELETTEDRARNIVINTVNLAKQRVGIRQALEELAKSYEKLRKSLESDSSDRQIALRFLKRRRRQRKESRVRFPVAKNIMCDRINVYVLVCIRYSAGEENRVSLKSIESPITKTAELIIIETIENNWELTKVFHYHLHFKGSSTDEMSKYYYYEAIFSQPTATYPIPQATASVFFRIQVKSSDDVRAPTMLFRLEGQSTDHDVRSVAPIADWILAIIQMKLKFFRRIEMLQTF